MQQINKKQQGYADRCAPAALQAAKAVYQS